MSIFIIIVQMEGEGNTVQPIISSCTTRVKMTYNTAGMNYVVLSYLNYIAEMNRTQSVHYINMTMT